MTNINDSNVDLWYKHCNIDKNIDNLILLFKAFDLEYPDDFYESYFQGELCMNIKRRSYRNNNGLFKVIVNQNKMCLNLIFKKDTMYGEKNPLYRDSSGNPIKFEGIDCWMECLKFLFPWRTKK